MTASPNKNQRRGRPRLHPDESSRRVCLTFPESLIAKLNMEAKNRGISFAALIREKIS